ncbi:DUF4476 domain-containing protein [Niastella sp. OAS944]|uniref:DUF4476 domain-containing protein n=1 Tax=Niastella sp. OAS944 TaxID=2664089 RepID=UPI00346CD624|nr:hypothetical protein [Chitinophagaceae bacterium OAS944]
MKKTFIQTLFIVLAFVARAHAGNSDGILSITNLSSDEIMIEIDGKVYTDYKDYTTAFVLRDLRPGNHLIKVSILTKVFPFKRVMLYNKGVYVKPRFFIDIVINRFGRAMYDEAQMADNQYYDARNDVRNNYPNNGNNGGYNNGNNGGYNNGNNGGYNNGNNGNNNNNWPPRNNNNPNNNYPNNNYPPAPPPPPQPMNDNTFGAFIEAIRRESFDDSRKAIARTGIDQNWFTSAQAKTLLATFSFEASKLEIAKYMYGKTLDPKNYFIVYTVFSFSKSKEELAEYVRTYKPY